MQRTPLAVLITGLFCAPLTAQANEPSQLDTIVVTATRTPERLGEMPADVSVVTRGEIERAGQATLAELLSTLPGVEMTQSGGAGSVTSVFLRGANAGHTLVLVDGVRMTSATLGSARLEHIPTAMIERIEIVRGPMSHLYGSEAIGGVIQVFTRRASGEPHRELSIGAGSYGHGRADVSLRGETSAWRYALAAGHDQQAGFSAKPAAYADRDGYRNDFASLRLDRSLGTHNRLVVRAWMSDGRSQFDDGVTPYDSHAKARLDGMGVELASQLHDNWSSSLKLDRNGERIRTHGYYDPSLWGPGSAYQSDIGMTQWQLAWQLDGQTALGDPQLILERLEQRIGGDVGYAHSQRDRNALGLGWRKRWDGQVLGASVRHDDDSRFGGHATGALTYGLTLAPGWRASLAAGTAYKAPGFDDLYWPGQGNPDLKPESARNREISIRYADSVREVGATLYRNDVKGLIQWACAQNCADVDWNNDVWLPSNVASARLQGVSLAWSQRLGDWRLRGSLDLQSPENADTGKSLILRARRHGALAAEYAQGAWRFASEWVAQGTRYNDADNTKRLAGYGLVNLSLGYALAPAWRLDGRVNNVLDQHYERALGYAASGRNLFVTLRYAPK